MALSFRHIPGPKTYPIVGSLLQYSPFGPYSFDYLHKAKKENYEKFGKIYKETLGPHAQFVQIFDPESVGKVFQREGRYPRRPALPITLTAHHRDGIVLGLGSLNGEPWYKLRHSVQKLMMRPKAATVYLPAQSAVADDFLSLIDQSVSDDGTVGDFYQMILKYTMESIGTVCYSSRLGCLQKDLSVDSVGHRMLSATSAMFDAVQKTMFSFPWFALFRSPLYKQFIDAKNTCDRIAHSYVDQVNKCPHMVPSGERNGPDFLSSLIGMETLDADRIVAIANELFIAGIDSTANALSFVIYNLARNPKTQEKLAAEILNGTSMKDVITSDDIERMTYLRACVKESFRLNYPIEGGTIRILDQDIVLNKYEVPKGTVIAMNNQTMCLQEDYFDKPTEFIPERWLKSGSATLRPPPPFVLLPFGHGPRMCIGRRFAEQEIYLALIKMLRVYRVRCDDAEIGMINRVFTVPDKPLAIKFSHR